MEITQEQKLLIEEMNFSTEQKQLMSSLLKRRLEYENNHSHSHYSNIYTPDCIIKKSDIALRAVELGQETLSMVEHGYFSDLYETLDVANEHGLKLIFGSEFYFVKDRHSKDKANSHLLLLAKNINGQKSLKKAMSEANVTGFHGKPRLDEELLFSLPPDDVVVTTACIASPINKYGDEYAEYFIKKCKKYFGGNFYLEVQPHTNIKQVEFNKKLSKWRKKFGVEMILGIDSHYIYKDDAGKRDLFLKGKKIEYPEEEGFIIDYPTVDMVVSRMVEQNTLSEEEIVEAFNNSLVTRDFEGVYMDKEIKMPSLYPELTHEEKVAKLKEILNDAWVLDRVHIPKEDWGEYIEAIKFETQIIADTKMEDYFLMNEPIIKKAVQEYGGVLTRTGRGSAPSMYINKLLGFTEVDRLRAPITLYPTRFMSKSRILETKSLPDIDFNTADPHPFIRATKDFLGEDNCYFMVAYGKMKGSGAFRNYARALGYSQEEFNYVGKNLEQFEHDKKWGQIIEDSKMFLGVIDSIAPHPCACLLLSQPISEEIGIIRTENEFACLIDSGMSDKYKYLKNDYLTVTVWEIIAKVFDEIGKEIPDIRTLEALVKDDEDVWSLYSNGLVSTLNQAGTDSGKPQVMQYRPHSSRELSGWISAIRPAFSSMKHYFLNRLPFSYGIPEFDALLKDSDNFILYQENIMRALQYAGFSEDETYSLLKAIAKKKDGIFDETIYERFIDGFVEKTDSKDNALKVWQIMEDAVGYGFNSSHAYSMAMDSLYGAWLKAHYPLEYFTVALNINQDKVKIQSELINELPYFGITLASAKFGVSQSQYVYDKDSNTIYKGLKSIKYISEKVGQEMFELGKRNTHTDFIDFLIEIVENVDINTRQMSILIKLGFFEDFGEINQLSEIYDVFVGRKIKKAPRKASPLISRDLAMKSISYSNKHKDSTKAQRIALNREYAKLVFKADKKQLPLFTLIHRIKHEIEYLGYPSVVMPELKNKETYFVVEVNDKYTPVLTLYNIASGATRHLRVIKAKFFANGEARIREGNIITLFSDSIVQKPKNVLVDGKWEKDFDTMLDYLEKVKNIYR